MSNHSTVWQQLATRAPVSRILRHLVVLAGIVLVALPLWMSLMATTRTTADLAGGVPPLLPGTAGAETWAGVLDGSRLGFGTSAAAMALVTLACALCIACGKTLLSLLTSYALVFFRLPGKKILFALMLLTLMLPVEVRIVPTFQVVASLGLVDTFAGLTLPLMVSATAVLLFRQTFRNVPRELVEASRMDGAGPGTFFFRVLLPVCRNEILGMGVILFIYGWNQYLWPLLVSSREDLYTLGIGLNRMLATGEQQADWPAVMAVALITMLPPLVLLGLTQDHLVQGERDVGK